MPQNDEIQERANVPALFAQVTALLEDSHEIAVRGQNSKLEREDYFEAASEIRNKLDQIDAVSELIQLTLR